MFLLILLHVYFVSFLDKPEKSAPALSERAVAQRQKWNIPTDVMDYPVAKSYVDSLRRAGAKVYHTSRWMNGATVEMTPTLAEKAAEWSFVTAVEMTRDDSPNLYAPRKKMPKAEQGWLTGEMTTDAQLETYNLKKLHAEGYEGQGILMTVCDGAFANANTLGCFRKDQELGHFDLTDDQTDFYGWTGAHGTACLSAISGIREDYRGAATQAKYYLMRSEEEDHESPKEIDNLVVALETADSLGVNVFSVSLGYAYFDNDQWTLPKSALDGQSTRASRAATIAARKGMLVCVAAGNEGNKDWHTISVPADADSVLTVGAVSVNGDIASFSSFGPAADGRVKPDVCAVGWGAALLNTQGEVYYSNGTSFATPLLAGLAATLWSALPDENAMQIRERIINSADRYYNPDKDQYGYGIPDAWKAYTMKKETDVESVGSGTWKAESRKELRNGRIVIIRDQKEYDVLGNPRSN